MRFKSLFLGMLGAAVFVGCNNESPIGGLDTEKEGAVGISTTATFELKFAVPGTYAGSADRAGTSVENTITDAALVIYKLDGTPEALGYLTSTDFSGNAIDQKFTLKCYSGEKLIYLAVNLGGNKLVNTGLTGGLLASNAMDPYLGIDWTVNTPISPAVSFANLNAPIWATATSGDIATQTSVATTPDPTTGAYTPLGTSADDLIKALSGGGVPASGVLKSASTPNTQAFLMTNWGDASSQPTDFGNDGGGTGTAYPSTAKFTLKPAISAADSRDIAKPAADVNRLTINIQRALAKAVVLPITTAVADGAGENDGAGRFVVDTKWAAGNINRSAYPFQQYDGSIIKSTRYADTATILPAANNQNWANKLDNSRWIPTGKSYASQNLTVEEVRTQMGTTYANNAAYGTDTIYLTENNNRNTLDAYSTFVLLSGQYRPTRFVTAVDNTKNITWETTFPTFSVNSHTALDTLYYVQSYGSNTGGVFFLGMTALRQYVGWVQLNIGAANSPTNPLLADGTSPNPYYTDVSNEIATLKLTPNGKQADLQAYYQGYCFYRVWIRDAGATSSANKMLVRRNHIYEITINRIKGPGIADPNDVISSDPSIVTPIEEAETYVTATINLMKWHVVSQGEDIGL
jgi:hypothetical protein